MTTRAFSPDETGLQSDLSLFSDFTNDIMDRLIQNDCILPGQTYSTTEKRIPQPEMIGEKGMLFASLLDGLYEAITPVKKGKNIEGRAGEGYRHRLRIREDAIAWISTPENGMLGFDWYCNHLGLDAELYRQKILQLIKAADSE